MSRLTSFASVSVREDYLRNCCRPMFKPKWLRNRGAILLLIWSYLCFTVYLSFTIRKISRDPIQKKLPFSPGETISLGLLLPVGGWLADAFFGRYKVIRFGVWTMWFGAMLNGFSLVIGKAVKAYGSNADPWVSLFSDVIMGVGLAAFQANIVQFGIDQLIDASSNEITSFIMWYTMTIFICGISVQFSSSCSPKYVAVLVIALFLTLAIGSDLLFSHWLSKDHIISNPLPVIWKVIHFTIKAKCQRGWKKNNLQQHGLLSGLNIAKKLYNGSFTSEQVEDVKTFIRVTAAIATFAIAYSGAPSLLHISYVLLQNFQNWSSSTDVAGCFKRLNVSFAAFIFPPVIILVYQTVIHPLFHSCIPRIGITTKFILSIFLTCTAVLSLLGIEFVSYQHQVKLNGTTLVCDLHHHKGDIDVDFYWMILPHVLLGLSVFMFIDSGIAFICSQAPFNMKGLVLGIAYASFGVGVLIHAAILKPFTDNRNHTLWERAPLTCGIWYFMMEGVIILIGFIVVVVIVKTYKKRTRMSIGSQTNMQESDIEVSE